MTEFGREDLEKFLMAVDHNLQSPFRIDLIGEAVAILDFGAKRRGTGDIDLTTDIGPVMGAFENAREQTGLAVEVSTVSVYDVPYEYVSRLERLDINGLTKLQVFVPEKHDWALMKMMRSLPKDVMDIIEVHHEIGFNKDVLLARFLGEMTHVTGRPRTVIFDFLSIMKDLYGKEESKKAEEAIKANRTWQQNLKDTESLGGRRPRRR